MPNRTKLTPEKKKKFLEVLSRFPNVTRAAQAVGIRRQTAYDHRKTDTDFANDWDDAIESAVDRAEEEAFRRAIDGVEEPVFHNGEICGYKQKYSDTVLLAILNGRRGDIYRQRTEHTVDVSDSLSHKLDKALENARKKHGE